jgi:hypothetical protein
MYEFRWWSNATKTDSRLMPESWRRLRKIYSKIDRSQKFVLRFRLLFRPLDLEPLDEHLRAVAARAGIAAKR